MVSSNILAFMNIFDTGTFKIHLIRSDDSLGGPNVAYASSEEFEIQQNALDCSTRL
jgi:hypothetical protein